ncbi:VOC family protein [Cellulomonas sp.]|uniref:VOC family protein n=1 Tax=Cellulomonas sp. TaxID=40001 RepID=UPI003BAC3C11
MQRPQQTGRSPRELIPSRPSARGVRALSTAERVVPSSTTKVGVNRTHLHLTSSSLADQQATVAHALRLGGSHVDVGQLPEEGRVVLADPEGNELCVIEPGNRFLAGCDFLGEVACTGTRDVAGRGPGRRGRAGRHRRQRVPARRLR